MIFDKVYIVNVDRNIDKFKRVEARVKAIMPHMPIERISGIDREDLTEDWLNEKKIRPSPAWREPWSDRTFTKGDIACALSHAKAWEKIILDQTKVALLLEDDVVLYGPETPQKREDGFLEGCEKIEQEINQNNLQDFEYIYLARNKVSRSQEEEVTEMLVRPEYSYWCLASLISLEGAKKLFNIKYMENLIPSDEYVPARVSKKGGDSQANALFGEMKKLNAYSVRYGRNLADPEQGAFANSETGKGEIMELKTKRDYINDTLKVKIVTAATEETDGLRRLKESAIRYGIPLKVLGIEKGWTGGNVSRLENPGGGQKINLLKEYLAEDKELNDDDTIIFVDGYDVIFTKPVEFFLERYKKFNCKVLFAAERCCWPDQGLAPSYPDTDSPYKYLNSGTFIGTVPELKRITEEHIEDIADDQLYYARKFLSNEYDMKLDYGCEIFQTTEGCWNDMKYVVEDKDAGIGLGDITNTLFQTKPCVVHGNGSPKAKVFFNRICDYIGCNRLGYFGYNPIKERKFTKDYSISIFAFITSLEKVEEFFMGLAHLSYPKDKISVYVCVGNHNAVSQSSSELLKKFKTFKLKVSELGPKDFDEALSHASELGDDYTMIVKSNAIINNPYILENLIKADKNIIAPIMRVPDLAFANFWRGVDDNGWYEEFEDYMDIADGKSRGVWNCPHVSELVLIKKDFVNKCLGKFSSNYTQEKGDFITFCYNLRNAGDFVYADNRENYGYLVQE
jgi:GR25 family glycosyltransferase involved in LPS biosynthesis